MFFWSRCYKGSNKLNAFSKLKVCRIEFSWAIRVQMILWMYFLLKNNKNAGATAIDAY